jgi:hypothetical protein
MTASTPREDKKAAAAAAALAKIHAARDAATDEDRQQVDRILEKAKEAKRTSEVIKLLSGAAAIMFLDHNKQNRKWEPAVSEGYASQIANDEWEYTTDGAGNMPDGDIGNAQHRIAAVAMAGKPVELVFTYGMTREGLIAIDSGRGRSPATFLDIEGKTAQATVKQRMVQRAFATLRQIAASEEEARPFAIRSRQCGGFRDVVKANLNRCLRKPLSWKNSKS